MTQDLKITDHDSTVALGQEADAWTDLSRSDDVLMQHLAARYEAMTRNILSGDLQDSGQTHAIHALIKQLSQVQADVFALKSIVLGRDKMALTRDWEYQDPLLGHAALLGTTTAALYDNQGEYYVLPNPISLVGYGWHKAEENNTRSWCWSGPSRNSLLTIPRLFKEQVEIEIAFRLIKAGILPETGAIVIEDEHVPYDLVFDDDEQLSGTLIAKADLSKQESASFAIRLNLSETYSPRELAQGTDARKLGLCLQKLTVRKA